MVDNVGAKRIFALCDKYDISDDVKYDLELLVAQLSIFKNEILPSSQTETQRAKALQRIEALSAKLRSAIEGLSFEDRSALDCEYFGVNEPGFEEVHSRVGNSRSFDLVDHLLPDFEALVRTVRDRIKGIGESGQPPMTERQADFIRCIAQVVKRANIAPSYSGRFLEICTAVFNDAGLSFPDRAIRHFMKTLRPNLKASGYCL